jgi:hypothetical protein
MMVIYGAKSAAKDLLKPGKKKKASSFGILELDILVGVMTALTLLHASQTGR